MEQRIPRTLVLLVLAGMVALSGCVSVVPKALEEQVDRQVQLADLQRDAARYQGRMVVLGGRIAALRPSHDEGTEVEVTGFPVRRGRNHPRLSDPPIGQFLVAHQGPLNPDVYRSGRPVTVVGLVQGVRHSPGQDVPKPLIEPKHMYLWSDRPTSYDAAREPLFRSRRHFYRFHRFHRRLCDRTESAPGDSASYTVALNKTLSGNGHETLVWS